MPGLTPKDLEILKHYAAHDNRELYWNYLAQVPGNDGYGLLALGVVRNDNVPGQVANAHAQAFARRAGRQMSERDWEAFGIELMKLDFAERKNAFENSPQAALNLPGIAVMQVHDQSFENAGIPKEAWTPRRLMSMAGDKDTVAVQHIWGNMLDNQKHGLYRGVFTMGQVYAHTDFSSPASIRQAADYLADMGAARLEATQARANTSPDVIGAQAHYYLHSERDRGWMQVSQAPGAPPHFRAVNHPEQLRDLDDTRQVRLEREAKRGQFHPDDPYRSIAVSPQTLADAHTPAQAPATRLAGSMPDGASGRPAPFASSEHVDHPLYCSVRRQLAAQLPAGATVSEDRLAQLTLAAKLAHIAPHERLDIRVGETHLSLRGEHPAHLARVDLAAPVPPAEESARQAEQRNAEAAQVQQARQASGPAPRVLG